jgi:hypothetical protein
MAVVKAFTIASLPFVVAEAGTGIVSLLTGLLQIPPLFGLGMVVDTAILIVGVAVAVLRSRAAESGNGGRKTEER